MVHALNASSNLTDSGRRKFNLFFPACNIRMSSSVDFVFYQMLYYCIPVDCITANLVNKRETNKTHLIKTTMIDTY
jgi:hypothetical protein